MEIKAPYIHRFWGGKRRLWKVKRRLFAVGEYLDEQGEYLGENDEVRPDEEDSRGFPGRDPPFMEGKVSFMRRFLWKSAVYGKFSAVYSL